jgi:hypothetical protein
MSTVVKAPEAALTGLAPRVRNPAGPYVASAFLGALLIFLVQPMFAKMATPLLGGAPAVWNVSLVCFQAALLLGYAYAHALARLRSVRLQMIIHAAVMGAGLLCLPLRLSGLLGEPDSEQPILWLVGTFAVSIAPPFAALSATAPLIQHWYARSGRADASSPFHLYAASNLGSLIGLAAYPLLLEPFARLADQAWIWAAGYLAVFALLMTSAGLSSRTHLAAANDARAPAGTITWKSRLIWLALAFAPSSVLMGATSHITTDVAAAPFLWAPPLMVYLLSFVIVFAKTPIITQDKAALYAVLAVVCVSPMLTGVASPAWPLALTADLLAVFFIALACHGMLNARRPDAGRLTEFYLIMSLGGVLGGAFNALLAPVLFDQVIEYPLMLAISLLLLAGPDNKPGARVMRFVAGAALAAVAAWALRLGGGDAPAWVRIVLFGLPMAAMVLAMRAPLAAAAAFACAAATGAAFAGLKPDSAERSFFGVVKVLELEQGDVRIMQHGTTMHGAQRTAGPHRLVPMTYYAPSTPIGQMFQSYGRTARSIGVVGLGLGSVACYAQPGQSWTFYEIDPLVAETAADASRFTFMSACAGDSPVVLGDARVKLTQQPDGKYDLLLLDAFSSDSVPAHLLTREAMALYLSKLSEDGVLVFHISNRHLALNKVVARVAGAEGASALYQKYVPAEPPEGFSEAGSEVALVAKSPRALEKARAMGGWTELAADGKRPWTDDFSNIIGAMIERHAAE